MQKAFKDIIERLEELKNDRDCQTYCHEFFRKKCENYEKAIEIVNQVAEEYKQEVCEWKPSRKIDGIIMYGTSCYVEFEERLIRKYKYCPYCGKKIKVIGG